MEFDFTPEQRMIADTARKVGILFGPDYWREKDRDKSFPVEMWQAICDAGLAGVAIPAEFGGSGLGMLEMALVIETLVAGGAGWSGPDFHDHPDLRRCHRCRGSGARQRRPRFCPRSFGQDPLLHGADRTRRRLEQPRHQDFRDPGWKRLAAQRGEKSGSRAWRWPRKCSSSHARASLKRWRKRPRASRSSSSMWRAGGGQPRADRKAWNQHDSFLQCVLRRCAAGCGGSHRQRFITAGVSFFTC